MNMIYTKNLTIRTLEKYKINHKHKLNIAMPLEVHAHPVLKDGSVLLPEKPELVDRRVGDCLSVSVQEVMFTGRDSAYGCKLRANRKTRKKHLVVHQQILQEIHTHHIHTGFSTSVIRFKASIQFLYSSIIFLHTLYSAIMQTWVRR